MATPEQPPPEQLQPCRLPVPSHPSCPCAAVRAGGLPAVSSAGQPLARGVRADPRRGHQRAGWQQGGMGWADAVGGKGRLIFLSPQAWAPAGAEWHGVGRHSRWKRPFDFPILA